MREKITIVANGKEQEVYLVTIVTLDKYNSSYLVYTEEPVYNEMINFLLIGKIVENNGKTYLDNLSPEEDRDVKVYLGKELIGDEWLYYYAIS